MLFLELEIDGPCWTISILADEYTRDSLCLREFIVIIITIDHEDDIGILFY